MLAIIVLCSCRDSESYSHIHVYNNFNEPVDFTLNNERHQLPAKQNVYFKSPKRSQLFEFGQEKQLIKTKENETFLFNLAKDTVIKEQIFYTIGYGEPKTEGKIPSTLIKLRGKKYFGEYELITNKFVIKDLDFTINEDPLPKLSSKNPYQKNRTLIKVSSVEEFMSSRKSMNDSQGFIEQILLASAKILNDDFTLKMQQQVIFIQKNGETIGDIGEARVSHDDYLEIFRSNRFYNEQKDGKIKETIITIPRLNTILEDGSMKENTRIDVVLCANHNNPRIIFK